MWTKFYTTLTSPPPTHLKWTKMDILLSIYHLSIDLGPVDFSLNVLVHVIIECPPTSMKCESSNVIIQLFLLNLSSNTCVCKKYFELVLLSKVYLK